MDYQVQNQEQIKKPMPFSVVIQTPTIQSLIRKTLGDEKRASRFIAAISSAVATNPMLQKCSPNSVITAALLGESLSLSPSPQLGQYYIVPFNDKNQGSVGQFQLGYKGYIQLAIRSGQYKKLNVIAIKEGELIRYDALNEEIEVNLIDDERSREQAKTVGYFAMFEYVNGFRKTLYWTRDKMEAHATKYSQAYRAKKGFSFWEKDFDAMAYKTMLRQLISKWGIMSIEMQTAFEKDQTTIDENGNSRYVDNEKTVSQEIAQEANKGPQVAIETTPISETSPIQEPVQVQAAPSQPKQKAYF